VGWFSSRLADEGVDATLDTPLAGLNPDQARVITALVMEAEDAFGVPIPDHCADELNTVGDVIRIIRASQAGDSAK